jgi:type 1 glutamine amidotransferase
MHRREMLLTAGATVIGLSAFPLGWVSAADNKKQKILYYTKSAGFVHPEVDRKKTDGKLSRSEQLLTQWGDKSGFDVVCSQDPAVFDGDLDQFDAIAFYTSGNCVSDAQKKKFLDAIAAGKAFVGIHSATDTFRKPDGPEIDPYIAMIGAEFIKHDAQQKAKNRVVDPKFPGMEGLGEYIELYEEWYTCKKYAKDLHVILVQETEGMKGPTYQRPPFPATWAHKYGKGRVFYTSLGHREDIWKNKIFQQILLGGIAWALGNAKAEIPPNIDQVTPDAEVLSKIKKVAPKATN